MSPLALQDCEVLLIPTILPEPPSGKGPAIGLSLSHVIVKVRWMNDASSPNYIVAMAMSSCQGVFSLLA